MDFEGYTGYSIHEIGTLQHKYYNIGIYMIVCFTLSVMFLLKKITNEWLDIYTKIKKVKCVVLYTADEKCLPNYMIEADSYTSNM